MAGAEPGGTDNLTLTPLAADDILAVRDLHARSFAALAGERHDQAQIAAHLDLIAAPEYAREVLGANLILARDAEGRIVGTAGWQPQPDRDATARIRKVFIDPAMARRGLGRRLVLEAEARARDAGFRHFYVRANVNAVPLYRALGYDEIETGEMPAANGVTLPVVFMEKRDG